MLSPRCSFAQIYGSDGVEHACISCVDLFGNQKKMPGCAPGSGLYLHLYGSIGVIVSKKPGKIGIFGAVPCFMLVLVGVAQKLRPQIFVK